MISVEDRVAILAEVERFGERQLAPITQFSEHTPDQAALRAAMEQALEMGILPRANEPGFGLWELADESGGFQLHLEVLVSLARHSAALAYEMHLSALARRILAAAGVENSGPLSVVLDGHGGLARYSLARYLACSSLDADDLEILRQYFTGDRKSSRFYFSALMAESLLLPQWQDAGGLEWHLYPASAMICDRIRVHGLDSISHYTSLIDADAVPLAVFRDSESPGYAHVLALHSAGLMAIQTGIAVAAYERAREYAATRSQGGCLIREHAAVQQLLMNSRAGANIARALLAGLPVPQSIAALGDIMERRAGIQEQLYTPVSDALLVFGGYGYMQDYGLERLLRDQNHLAQLGGTAGNTRLFLAALENQQAMAGAL